ncbi:MAG: zinc ribbon domain-containing protein [Actinobacteria bacterium]|nr:zinc ribbon domain-containing protein [Actinomycetota bacterium]
MGYCEKCGKELSEGALFCPACGNALGPGETAEGAGNAYGQVPPPAPPPSPYAPSYPPPPPKSSSGVWKKVVIVVVVLLLLLGAGAVVSGIFIFRAVKAPVDVTNRYIAAVNEGDAGKAWGLIHPQSRLKRDYDRRSFEEEVVKESVGVLKSWNAHEVSINGSRARVGVDLEFTDGSTMKLEFELRREGNDWLIFDYVEV